MPDRDESTILLTGGTGVLGWLLARRFAEAGHQVYLLIRKGSRKRLRERVSDYRQTESAAADRIRLFTGDLLDPALVDEESRGRILAACTGVVHCAHERRADKTRHQVFDVNVGGTRALLALAEQFEHDTQRFLHVSDLRVSGDHRGVYSESMLLVNQGFGGDHALESRLLAERWVRRARKTLPVTVLRTAHPVGVEADPSRIPDALRDALRGRPSLRARLAASPSLHVVLASHVADVAVAAYADPVSEGETLHLADPAAPTVAEVFAALGRGAPRTGLVGLPGPWAAYDTTATDSLLKRAGLERPSRAEVIEAVRGALG